MATLEGKAVGSAYGTYPNYDHFAGFLEMALPLVLALLIAHIDFGSQRATGRQRSQNLRKRIAQLFASGIRFNTVAIYTGAALAILLGLIFSRSRTAIALTMLCILLCALIFGSRVGGQRSSRLVTLLTVIGFALALEIGLAPVLARFADGGLVNHTRLSIFAGTIQGIREFFPFGSGLGSYPAVFRRFQPGDVPYFVNHAHNDYLEWLFEGGLATAVLMLAFLTLYVLRWREIWPVRGGALGADRFRSHCRGHRSPAHGAARADRLQPAHTGQRCLFCLPRRHLLSSGSRRRLGQTRRQAEKRQVSCQDEPAAHPCRSRSATTARRAQPLRRLASRHAETRA